MPSISGGIYEGVWVGEKSAHPEHQRLSQRRDRGAEELKVPVVRWPGGCFADEYHWRDGIGDRAKAPAQGEHALGRRREDNEFGTHEFMDFAEMIGAKAYISGNVGSGSPQEMADWMEYMTSDTDSTLANAPQERPRQALGSAYFAIGNETWGCGGNMRRSTTRTCFASTPPTSKRRAKPPERRERRQRQRPAVGRSADARSNASTWTRISHHYYTLPTGMWDKKGKATGFPEAEWISTLKRTLRMESIVTDNAKILDKHDPQKRVGVLRR